MTFARALLCVCLAAAAHPAAAEVFPGKARSVTQGLFCQVEPTETRPAEGTISGVIDTYDRTPEFLVEGAIVPAALGLSFGLHIVMPKAWAGPVRHEVSHPPMGPDGVTLESWQGSLPAEERHYVGFQFEEAYELVTGPWALRAWAGETLLYEARFEVVPAAAAADLAALCAGPDLLS